MQDSESPTALDQKKCIKSLVQQGWSKNEIIYEQQRLFGTDILIMPEILKDERTIAAKTAQIGLPLLGLGLMFLTRGKMRNIAPVEKAVTKPSGRSMEDLKQKLR